MDFLVFLFIVGWVIIFLVNIHDDRKRRRRREAESRDMQERLEKWRREEAMGVRSYTDD